MSVIEILAHIHEPKRPGNGLQYCNCEGRSIRVRMLGREVKEQRKMLVIEVLPNLKKLFIKIPYTN